MRDRAAWLEERRKGIGSSDAAGILGVSPWASPLSVWADKMGIGAEDDSGDEKEIFIWGHLLEPVILAEFARRAGLDVEHHDQEQVVAHPDVTTHMACTPDGYVLMVTDGVMVRLYLIEIKTTSLWNADAWADGVPLHYQVQVQHQMACTGLDHAFVVVLIGGQELRWYEVDRNDRFIATLERECREFWELYVETGEQPPSRGTAADVAALVAMHPDDSGETIELPAESLAWDSRLLEVKAEIKTLTAQKEELESQIKAAIGAATIGELPDGSGRYSWKTQERKAFEVKAGKSRVLRRAKGGKR